MTELMLRKSGHLSLPIWRGKNLMHEILRGTCPEYIEGFGMT